jgi:hypothetical protein
MVSAVVSAMVAARSANRRAKKRAVSVSGPGEGMGCWVSTH